MVSQFFAIYERIGMGTAIIIAFVLFVIWVSLDEYAKRMNEGTSLDAHFDSAIKEDKDESA